VHFGSAFLAFVRPPRSLTGSRRALGEDRPDTTLAISSMGVSYLKMGRLGEAGSPLREAWRGRVTKDVKAVPTSK
jgi:hypothetical protein